MPSPGNIFKGSRATRAPRTDKKGDSERERGEMVQWSEQTIERGEMRAPACSLISSGEERDSGITTPSIWKVSARSAAPEKCREIRGGCWGQKAQTGPALSQ